MPQNKSHHFVPQFLLRFFSTDGSSVGLYNLRSGKIVTGSSLKHQACRDWFYGRDGKAEHALGEIEGGASTVLRRMIETDRPPKRYSDDHRVLATFLLIQSARTAQAAAEVNEMANKVGKLMLRNTLTDPELLAVLDDVTIQLTEPAAEALRPAVMETPVILDLKIKLLRNVSSTPFVLGDHPAVKHNGLYSGAEVSVLGLANLGLQFVVPFSPEYAVVFYDEEAYSLGSSASNVVKVSSAGIAMALNEFQWANALDNVYFRPGDDPARWAPARDRLAELRRDERVSVGEDEVRLAGTRRAKIISMQTVHFVAVPLAAIQGVTLSPWLPPGLLASTRDLLNSIPGCAEIRVSRSELISNEEWKNHADRLLSDHHLAGDPPLKGSSPVILSTQAPPLADVEPEPAS